MSQRINTNKLHRSIVFTLLLIFIVNNHSNVYGAPGLLIGNNGDGAIYGSNGVNVVNTGDIWDKLVINGSGVAGGIVVPVVVHAGDQRASRFLCDGAHRPLSRGAACLRNPPADQPRGGLCAGRIPLCGEPAQAGAATV